ncbi:hypothetical protein M0R88_08040 [Halorussus gelatinilyticus]|uniref:Uncharacterized protein n=1 Tax=Halorussus gelatinilyticus TaxID=2937524 RepID=A0A8U0ILL3_9EURY|nr:hypothetical protein [Halorussus gelatinilyticus]UPW02033.1 hypothetical protein M0R88_08040 [Halorussus gelatinilyticus]
MKTDATPTADDPDDRIETYARTASDGEAELVFYNPHATHEWVNATESSTVELEDWR